MNYTQEQLLFLDFVSEAQNILGYKEIGISVIFGDFPCKIISTEKKSLSYYPPMIPIYKNYELLVVKDWVQAVFDDYYPTLMRSVVYYYIYGFYKYTHEHVEVKTYPQDSDALSFAMGLCLLNGIPINIPNGLNDRICSMLKQFTNRNYKIGKGISACGTENTILTLDDVENNRLASKLEYFRAQSKTQKIDIRFGTKEHPFKNINEAIEYIKYLENEAVGDDLYINSEFIRDKYRYDFGYVIDKSGKKRCGGLYKVPWASANTAHVQNHFPANSFVVTQLNPIGKDWEWLNDGEHRSKPFIPLFSLKPNLYKRRFLFRGQTEEYEDRQTKEPTCKPNLYRSDVEANPLPHRIKAYEMACLVAQYPLVKLLGICGVEIFNEPFRFQLNRLGIAQHYYNKTSFLDLTSDIEVAKFFATSSYNKKEDKYYPCAPDDKLGVLYIYDMRFPDEFRTSGLPQLSTIGKQYVFMRSALQSGFLLNMPKGLNLHELPNVYRIYFEHDEEISRQTVEATNYGDRYFPKDALSRFWANMREAPNSEFSISKKTREMYLRMHPEDFMDMKRLDKLLRDEEFGIGNNLWPEFPEEILNEYFLNAPQLWQQFCSDIHFVGSEGVFMEKALKELPNKEKYRKYFFR